MAYGPPSDALKSPEHPTVGTFVGTLLCFPSHPCSAVSNPARPARLPPSCCSDAGSTVLIPFQDLSVAGEKPSRIQLVVPQKFE